MIKYHVYNTQNIDTYTILISTYNISIKFYSISYWCIYFEYFIDKNVLCIYLPILDLIINKNET